MDLSSIRPHIVIENSTIKFEMEGLDCVNSPFIVKWHDMYVLPEYGM